MLSISEHVKICLTDFRERKAEKKREKAAGKQTNIEPGKLTLKTADFLFFARGNC